MTEFIERKYPVSEGQLGKPLNQREMYGLNKEKSENLHALDWLLTKVRVGEVFESLRCDNDLYGTELIKRIKQPDASVVELEFRWPVKSDVINEGSIWNGISERAKSFPASFNSIVITINRVQFDPPTLEFGNVFTIEGKETEFIRLTNLVPYSIKKAIERAFSNPKTGENQDNSK